jgi:hypothetical protein
MGPDERLGLAHLAYLRAVALARVQSTPATWKRLLRAAKNVEVALRERYAPPLQARSSSGGAPRASSARGEPPRSTPPAVSPAAGSRIRRGSAAEDGARASVHSRGVGPRRQELATEWARARALAEQARRLARDSRALCSSMALLLREACALRASVAAAMARLPAPASPRA